MEEPQDKAALRNIVQGESAQGIRHARAHEAGRAVGGHELHRGSGERRAGYAVMDDAADGSAGGAGERIRRLRRGGYGVRPDKQQQPEQHAMVA